MTAQERISRLLSRPGASVIVIVVLFVLALALGRVVSDQLSESQASSAAFPVRSAVSDGTVHLDYADIDVVDVRATNALAQRDEIETTTATFLVVDLELIAPERALLISGLRLRAADGTEYLPSSSNRTGCGSSASLATGVRAYWMACIEVPDDQLTGATLLVSRGDPDSDLDRRDQTAEIDLEIDAARAADLSSRDAVLPASLPDDYPYDTEPVEVTP